MTTERIDIVINESGGRTVKRSLDDIADSAQRGEKSLGGLNGGLSGTSQASAFLVGSLKALAAGFAALRLGSLVSEASQLSQRYNELGIVLNIVGRNAGLMKSDVDATTEAVRKQGISMIESRQIVTRMIQSQIDLSKATELARLAQDAAVIGQINSSEALDRLVFGITSAQVEVLRGIGINVSFEQSYTKLAKEIGVTQNALTEQQKLQARLNVVLDEASKITGVYEGAMENAGKQMRSTQRLVEDLKVKVGGLFDQTSIFAVTAYTNSLKDADAQIDQFTETGQIKAWGDAIARAAAFAADSVRSVGIVFDIAGKGLGAYAAQAAAIARLDFKGAAAIGDSFSADFDSAINSMSKMRDLVESQIVQRDMLTKTYERESSALRSNTGELNNNTGAVKSNGSERARFLESLQDEVASIGKNEFALKRMQAAKFGAANAAEPLIATLEQENKRINQQEIAVTALVSDLNKYKQITESVMTEQEKFNAQVEELNRLRNLKNGAAISEETYARALKKARDELDGTTSSTRTATDQISQMWIQAGRNIQSSLGNLVFDFFNGGLDNMVKNAGNAVLRILSEFAGLKIAQTIGLTSLFTAGTAAASTGAAAGGGMSLLSGASLAANGLSLFKSGFGATSLISGVGSILPGSAGAFFSGVGGGAIPGVSSSAALAGGSFGAILGPVAALAGVDVIGRMLAGDKKLGGAEMIPVLGGFLAALFGRGPLKFKEQTLLGNVSTDGFSGALVDRYKASGGLIRGSKTDNIIIDTQTGQLLNRFGPFAESGIAKGLIPVANERSKDALEIGKLLSESFSEVADALFKTGENLGISTDGLKGFNTELKLVSEKGKTITEEQISKEIERITDEMARGLLPTVDQFSKNGESAFQTLTRFGQEFKILEQAAISTGRSFDEAKTAIAGMQITARTTLIDQLGGVDAASQKIGFFMDNFLSDSEKTRILFEQLDPEMKKLGFSAAITRGEFVKLVQSVGQVGGITTEQYAGLLNLASSFDQLDKIRTQLTGTTGTLVDHERSLLDIRTELTSTYQKERGELQNTINQFGQLATNIKSARDGLLLGDLSPLTPQQRLEEARNQFNQVRLQANSGDQNALAQLPQVAQNFLKASQVYNASGAAYQSDFGLVQNVLQNAEKSALSQVDLLQSQLTKLDDSVSNLIDINTGTKTTNDLLKEIKAAVLSGSGNPGITTDQIRSYLSANPGLTPDQVASAAAQYGVSGGQLSAAGYNIAPVNQSLGGASVTDRQIRDFVSANTDDPMAIYKAAVANGISSARLAQLTGISIADIEAFVRKNNLPSFAVGTDFVSRTGLAMVHRAEAIVPSSAIDEIKKLREELAKLREEQNRQTGDLIKVIDITNRQNAEIIAKSNRETAKEQQWSDRSKAALA